MVSDGNEAPITSDQMYKIEEKGHDLLGMQRVYMMENAGHGIADIVAAIDSKMTYPEQKS